MGLELGHGDRRPLALPVCRLELGWWDVVAGAVQPFAVPPRHPSGRRQLDLLDRPPRSLTMDQLGLVEAVDRLGQGIVVAVPRLPTLLTASASASRSV
jgi:hypothetical protein